MTARNLRSNPTKPKSSHPWKRIGGGFPRHERGTALPGRRFCLLQPKGLPR